MILTRDEILAEIEKGSIRIEPLNRKNIGPASYDLTLAPEFRLFKNNPPVALTENTDYRKFTRLISINSIVLKPGELVLGITREKITLPGNVCGWLEGRSRFARLGLQVHITAAFVQPGVSNRQVLEMKNDSPMPLRLKSGLRVCQIIFQRTEGKAKYKGIFQNQRL